MRRALLPEFTYRQGWWLLGAGIAALVVARVPSRLLALAFFLVGMVLLSIVAATFIRIETEKRGKSDV
jgi:cell division protein FtsW (lipid II flippase)